MGRKKAKPTLQQCALHLCHHIVPRCSKLIQSTLGHLKRGFAKGGGRDLKLTINYVKNSFSVVLTCGFDGLMSRVL